LEQASEMSLRSLTTKLGNALSIAPPITTVTLTVNTAIKIEDSAS
jgi:hypothetical protein